MNTKNKNELNIIPDDLKITLGQDLDCPGALLEFKRIVNFETLYTAMKNCQKNVMWKDSVAHFSLNSCEEITKLLMKIYTDTMTYNKPRVFKVFSPKKREIVSICFKDRVLQRCLNDEYIYPLMTKDFIYDNCACQKEKGTDFARDRLARFLHREYINNGNSADGLYFLQMDIKGYYPNMDQDIVENMFKSKLNPLVFNMVKDMLEVQYPGEVGYNPGSQLIQIAGISLLNPLDHYIKEELKCKNYLRYMDDSVIISDNKEYLETVLSQIVAELHKIKCTPNIKKTCIKPIENGVPFLGFIFRLTKTGKVLRLIKPEAVKRERRHLRGLVRRYKAGLITKQHVNECFASWLSYANKGNTWHVIQKMKKYYYDLWRNNNNYGCSSNT